MKLISLEEVKKNDLIIIKNNANMLMKGLDKVTGDVYFVDSERSVLVLRCQETDSFEHLQVSQDKIFLL